MNTSRFPGDEGFTASMATCLRVRGANHVQMARARGGKKSPVARAPYQGIAAHFSIDSSVSCAQSPIRAANAAVAINSIGGRILFAPIAWRVRLLPAAERLMAGAGGSARTARADCQPHSERHLRPIANAHTHGVPDSAVCAGNRFIASAGMLICGTPAPTRMRSGTAAA